MSVITFRTDVEVDRALAEMTEMLPGKHDRSGIIREALLIAYRTMVAERLRHEAAKLASDPLNLREVKQVQVDMEPLRAW